MKIKGKLCISRKNDNYIVASGGRNINLSEYLDTMLLENVKLLVKDNYSGKVLIDTRGKLVKKKVAKCFYLYHVGDCNVDDILWDLIGSKLEIELKNIGKDKLSTTHHLAP